MAGLLMAMSMVFAAQGEQTTAASVVARYIEAKGGEAKLKSIENYTGKGVVFRDGKQVGAFQYFQAANHHYAVDQLSDGSTRTHGTNGEIAWRVNVDGTPTILAGKEAAGYIRYHAPLHPALHLKSQLHKIEYAGKRLVDGVQLHALVFHAENGDKTPLFFDVETGFLVRAEYELGGEQQTKFISETSDYRELDGIMVPHRQTNRFRDYTIEFRVESFEVNSIKDMSIFRLPDSVAAIAK